MHTTRRNFLKASLGTSSLLALGSALPCLLRPAACLGATSDRGRKSVLVVLQLSGGNDGLNTLVPFEDDAYHRSRPTLRLAADRVLKLESGLGFHPDMPALHRLYHESFLAIVQGVGYPNSTRDHDQAKRDWHTACPAVTTAQTGWLGRAIDHAFEPAGLDAPGVFVGQIKPPFSLHAEKAVVPSIRSLDEWRLPKLGSMDGPGPYKRLAQPAQRNRPISTNPLRDFMRSALTEACSGGERLEHVLERDKPAAGKYPDFPLARTLRSVAQLIRADLGVRICFAELGGGEIGGFDTHAGQAINHGALLRELSESIAAFVDDLRRDRLLDSVLLMTVSEFGRTLSENGRRGTDHGAAAPVFLAGGTLKNRLIGSHPSLTDLDNDAPRFHTDFRRLYATVLDRWLGVDSQPILGGSFPPLDGVIG